MFAFLMFKNSVFVSIIVNQFKFVYPLRFSILHNSLLLLCRHPIDRAFFLRNRERVGGWYNGWLHILLIYTIGFTV